MGSKSSSGSLVKSVESMLPKGVNLKHVLLAVLVGLLLCMMFSQNVEGIKNIDGSTSITDSGICTHNIYSIPQTRCVVDKYKASANTADGAAAPVADATNGPTEVAINGMSTACGTVDKGLCNTADTSDGNEAAASLRTAISMHNSDPLHTASKDQVAAAGYLSCKLQEDDQCGPAQEEACKSFDACEWNRCGDALGNDQFPFFGPSSTDGDPEPDMMGGAFDKWRDCLFTKNKGNTPSGTPMFEVTTGGVGGVGLLKATYPLTPPLASTVAGVSGKTMTATAGNVSAKKFDESGDLSKGEIPGSAGTATTGLTGWLHGKAGVQRAPTVATDTAWTEANLRTANAIPLDKDGKVMTAMKDYLPTNLTKGLENMYKWCGYGLTTNDAKNVAVGWGDDLRTLKCLNYNPNISTISAQTHRPQYPCVDRNSQDCKSKTNNASCGADEDMANCWSLSPPQFSMIANSEGPGDALAAGVGAVRGVVTGGVIDTAGAVCNAGNAVKNAFA